MTGTAPTVSLALDSITPYTSGAQLTATATIGDADTHTDVIRGTDVIGVVTTVTTVHTDTAGCAWSWKSTGIQFGNGSTITVPAPSVSDVLVCTVTDAEGNVAIAEIPVEVDPPLWTGTTTAVNGAAPSWAPQADAVRVYTPPGHGCYTWTSAAMVAALAQKPKCIHLSFKDSPTAPGVAAQVQALFDGIPAGLVLRITVDHEPEQGPAAGDPTVTQFDANWVALLAILKPHPKRSQIVATVVLTEYAELHGKGPWTIWWIADADEIGLDCYPDAISTTSYPAPEPMFALLLAIMAATGKPGVVPEYAMPRLASDPDGSQCAAAITAHVAYLRKVGVSMLIWWGGSPFQLDARAPELAAWRNALAGK